VKAKTKTKVPRAFRVWLTFTVVALAVHVGLGRVVGGRDLIAALLVHHDVPLALGAVALILARFALFLLAPGWALHIAVTTYLASRPGRDPRAGSS